MAGGHARRNLRPNNKMKDGSLPRRNTDNV